MDASAPVPLLLCIDVEPDLYHIGSDRTSSFDGFTQVADFLMELRPRLEQITQHPVNYSWFVRMDPQIEECFGSASHLYSSESERFAELLAAGDELGLHTHAFRWDSSLHNYSEVFDDDDWIEHCLESSFDTYLEATGSSCRSHRFGAGFFSNEVVDVLVRRGVQHDLTCEPGRLLPGRLTATGALVGGSDQRRIPRHPYRPSRSSFQRQDPASRDGLLLIPLTAASYSRAIRKPDRWIRGIRGPYYRTHRLWRSDMNADRYWLLTDRTLRALDTRYLAFSIRSDMLLSNPTADAVRSKLEGLLTHPIARSVRFTTPSAWQALT